MIRSLELENFKGIGERQRIDFAPLTLLFGANSAGKSTLLQALLYLQELLDHGDADVDRTELGGSVVELGGFSRLVHRHETDRTIMLRVEFATPAPLDLFGRAQVEFPFPDLDDEVENVWIELSVQHRVAPGFRGPMIERAAVGIAGHSQPLVWLETVGALREGEPLYCRINLAHPILEAGAADVEDGWNSLSVPEPVWHRATEADPEGVARIGLNDLIDIPAGRRFPLIAIARNRCSAVPPLDEPIRLVGDNGDSIEKLAAAGQIRAFLEMVVLGTIAQLASVLREAIYVGPLRTIPPRGFLYERVGRLTDWASGLAAWDLLLADRGDLVERTNFWLGLLEAGCQVVVQELFDRDADAEDLSGGNVDKTVRRLLLDTGSRSLVLPSEVGAGISQLIPVIVAAIVRSGGLSMVEQPEIHVHPAVQVRLGDLFIEAVTRDASRRLLVVETHSEHLILRLLRRIRETNEAEVSERRPAFTEEQLSVLYVENIPEGVRVRRLRVNDQGEFVDRWPKGFFAERMEELL